ncbi:MAG: glycosyltransferase family 4 protein [Flavobacteriaceae bacterium]|nr:glycosyltransferase family 4 protein [Flavobacteriaceae bacterium]
MITTEFPPQPGGIGNHAYNLASQLQINNYLVTVLTDNRSNEGIEEFEFDSKHTFLIKRIKIRSPRFLMYFERLRLLFSEINNNDIIIASGKFSLWMVAFASLFYRKKYVAVIHGSEVNFQQKTLHYLVEKSLQQFDKIIAVSNFTKSLLSEKLKKRTQVIPNGFSQDILIKKALSNPLKGNPKLLTVGNVTTRKGQLNVIKMLPQVLKTFPEVHYHCVGLPSQKEEFLEKARQLGVENQLTFHGRVSDGELVQFLQNSDIFVMLSDTNKEGDIEGFGIAILEANYFGKPAIGSLNCGIEDAIVNGKTGYLIQNKDSEAFVKAITEILDNYSQFSEHSKQWAAQHQWEKIIEKYLKALEF